MAMSLREKKLKFVHNTQDKCQKEINNRLQQILTEYNRRLFALHSYQAARMMLESDANATIQENAEFARLLARLNDEFHRKTDEITKAEILPDDGV
jgi:hypothetical protein